jgi:hypothetical protein
MNGHSHAPVEAIRQAPFFGSFRMARAGPIRAQAFLRSSFSGRTGQKTFSDGPVCPCERIESPLCTALPYFARACGRVPVGGHPGKRPDSRPRATALDTPDWQPEAKPAHLALSGERDLKQRRHGLFWSPSALQRSATEEACLIIAGCADRESRSKPRQHVGFDPENAARVSKARPARSSSHPIELGGLVPPVIFRSDGRRAVR